MRAVVCPALGHEPILQDCPSPNLGAGQVRIKVAAAGVNFADTLLIKGSYQEPLTPPFIPGLELSGHVTEVAADVEHIAVGQAVIAAVRGGAWAEEIVTDACDVYSLPPSLDIITAAGLPIVYGTSLSALTKAGLQAGEFLVVQGASGGVGLTAVEVGHQMGAIVIACAGSTEKLALARAYGATHLLDSRAPNLRDRIKDLTDGVGAHVAYDPVGGSAFDDLFKSLRPGGRILVIGFASGTVAPIPANIVLVKNLSVLGINWGGYRKFDRAVYDHSITQSIALWAAGRLRPHVSNVLALEQASEALALLKNRAATGKVILRVAAE